MDNIQQVIIKSLFPLCVHVCLCRLLDSFHDLNKMIGQRYKRANGVSRDLLLKTLHLEQPHTVSKDWLHSLTNTRLAAQNF